MLVAVQEIADKYPPWLERQAAAGSSSTLSPADLDRYRRQYDCITRLCAAYETEPGNTAKIMGLLQEVRQKAHSSLEVRTADMLRRQRVAKRLSTLLSRQNRVHQRPIQCFRSCAKAKGSRLTRHDIVLSIRAAAHLTKHDMLCTMHGHGAWQPGAARCCSGAAAKNDPL